MIAIKRIILSLALLLPAILAKADTTSFTMSGPNAVAVGEQFRLSLTLDTRGKNLQLPDMSDFNVLMGPSTSSSTSIEIINGRTTRNQSYSYIFILQAKKPGTYTINPAAIEADGKMVRSNSLTIKVVKGKASAGNATSGGQRSTPNSSGTVASKLDKDDLFVKVNLDKTNVYKGEQIIATIKIYVSPNVPITNFDDVQLPSYAGFWTQDIDIPNQIQFTREVYHNKIYQVGVLKKTILFPQQTGKITIDPFEITCLVRQRVQNSQSFFDNFFDNFRTVKARVTSEPVNVYVKPLPAAPDGFYGGVGQLKMTSSIDKTSAKANDAVTLKITVSGSGNLRLIDAPKVNFPADFDVYDPKTTEKLKSTNNGLTGSKDFEYLAIPRHQGNFTIPPVTFSWFDPRTEKYHSVKTTPYELKIAKGDTDQNATVTSAYSKEDVKFIGKDIRFIKQNQYRLSLKDNYFFGSLVFGLIYLVALLVFVLFIIVYRKKLKENANLQLVRHKKANKVARKRLREAAGYVKSDQAEAFYESVLKAFWGYLSDKLSIPVADLSRDRATAELGQRKVNSETIKRFIAIVDTCEFARYAPSAANSTPADLYEQAAELMGKMEKQIR